MGDLINTKGNSKGPQYQPSNVTTRQELPPYIESALKEQLVPGARQEAKKNRVAPFNADQKRGFDMARRNVGQGTAQLGRAEGYFNKAAIPLEDINYEAYMNPYIKNVLNQQIEGLQDDYQYNKKEIDSQAALNGMYGGGGTSVLHDKNKRNTQKLIDQARERGLFNAFENAQSLGLKNVENSERAGYNQIKLGDVGREYANEDLEKLFGIGGMQQGQQQRENYQEREGLNFLLSMLSGAPMETSSTQTSTPSYTSTSRKNRPLQLLGTALQAAGTFF